MNDSIQRNVNILVLESQLDKDLRSSRSQKEFMRLLGQTFSGLSVFHREIHSFADLEHFIGEARKYKCDLIHYIGHGDIDQDGAFLRLTNDDTIKLSTAQPKMGLRVFHDLRDVVLLFSCCGVGDDEKSLLKLKQVSGARAIFAYRTKTVYDYQAFLTDSMLYQLLYGPLPDSRLQGKLATPEAICERVNNCIEQLLLYRRGRKDILMAV
ncbi:MAG: hypothetical protein Q7K03_01050 [Dehalococcoidia bacterium]|nr:hypothetical protein [Dehalococcoidia bacterium]